MTERIPKIIVVGPAFIDMAIKCEEHPAAGKITEGSGFTCTPAGAGVMDATQMALCGCETCLLTRVGEDCFGEMIRQNLRRHSVLTDLVYSTQAMSTGIVVTIVNSNGENSSCRSQGATRIMSRDEIECAAAEQQIGSADAVLVNDSIPRAASVAAIRSAQIHKTRVILSVKLPGADRDAIQSIDWPMEFYNADIIVLRFKGIMCGSELGAGGEGDLKFVGTELVAHGANCVVISLGWRGALVIDRQGPRHLPGIPTEVVDQNGCDAAFTGALTACYGTGDSPDKAVRFAIAAEALMRSRFGLQEALPKKEEVLTLLQSQPD
ncbi:MAG: PfkB family carbohydrate kinase [Planctomycetales bacterium]|nr:PfkB family carbohydrate kinase [Planctomycetales bacterium]